MGAAAIDATVDVAGLAGDLQTLQQAYGDLDHWWPAASAFEVAVGAILIQQSRWTTVANALAGLGDAGLLDPVALASVDRDRLAAHIRPCGFFNQKTDRLRALAAWWIRHGGAQALDRWSTSALRAALLEQPGVGAETADAICAFGFGRAVVVVDAYARRIVQRTGRATARLTDRALREAVIQAVGRQPTALRRAHALFVTHAQQSCRRTPACGSCVLAARCAYASSSMRARR